MHCTACRHLLEGTNIVSITLAESFLLCISKQCLVVHGVVPLSVLCAFIIAHYRMFVNRQNAQSLQKFFVQGLLLWQLGPRRTCTAQCVYCIIIIVCALLLLLCMYCLLYTHCCVCVRMCCACLCASLPGLATPLLCALAATQTIDFVFFLGYECKRGVYFGKKIFLFCVFVFAWA